VLALIHAALQDFSARVQQQLALQQAMPQHLHEDAELLLRYSADIVASVCRDINAAANLKSCQQDLAAVTAAVQGGAPVLQELLQLPQLMPLLAAMATMNAISLNIQCTRTASSSSGGSGGSGRGRGGSSSEVVMGSQPCHLQLFELLGLDSRLCWQALLAHTCRIVLHCRPYSYSFRCRKLLLCCSISSSSCSCTSSGCCCSR
jgi:hypothetical protein